MRFSLGGPRAAESAPSGANWPTLIFAWLLYFSTGVIAATTPAFEVPIASDLHLDKLQMGLVFGTAQLAYAAASFGSGILVDGFGMYRPTLAGAVFVAASPIVRAFSLDFNSLAGSAVLWGLGSSLILIATNKVIGDSFVGAQRAWAIGLMAMAPVLGGVTTLGLAYKLLVPTLGGWRNVTLAIATVPIVCLALWALLSPRDRPVKGPDLTTHQMAQVITTIQDLMRIRNVDLMIGASVAWLFVGHSLNNWIPAILVSRDLGLAEANRWASLSAAAGIFSILLFLRPVSSLIGKRLMAGLAIGTAAAALGLAYANGLLLIVSLAITGLSRSAVTPLTGLVLLETPAIGRERTGAAIGLCLTVGQLGGFLGPFVIGWTASQTNSFEFPMQILAGVALLLALMVILVRERGPERD